VSDPDPQHDWFGSEPVIPPATNGARPATNGARPATNGHAVSVAPMLLRSGTPAPRHAEGEQLLPDPLAPQVYPGIDTRMARHPDPVPEVEVDLKLVSQLQTTVAKRVRDAMADDTDLSRGANARRFGLTHRLAAEVVDDYIATARAAGLRGDIDQPGFAPKLVATIIAFLTGLGQLQPLIEDPSVENIWVKGTRVRVVYADGRIDDTSFRSAATDTELVELLQRVAATAGTTERALSPAQPILHLRLRDGSRMTVIIDVAAHPVVAIRRHRIMNASLDQMTDMRVISPLLRDFLRAALAARLNIMIAGMPNAGKTTLLRSLADEIPTSEVFAVLETVGELGLEDTGRHPWALTFEERMGHGELGGTGRPAGQLTVNDLFPHMLRLSTTRIIVGEIREQETVAMFDAMTTTPGSLCTVHARQPTGVVNRLAELLMRYGASRNREGAHLTIANALDFVVFMSMDEVPGRPPRRYVSHVQEVTGVGEGGNVAVSQVFVPGPDDLAVPAGIRMSEWRLKRLERTGYNPHVLLTPQAGLERR